MARNQDLTAIRRMLVGKEGTMCSLRLVRDGISFAVHLIREQPPQSPQSIVHIVINDHQSSEGMTVRESIRHLSPLPRAPPAADGRHISNLTEEAVALWASTSALSPHLTYPDALTPPLQPGSAGSLPLQPGSGSSLQVSVIQKLQGVAIHRPILP